MDAFKVSAAAWLGFSTSTPAPLGCAIALLLATLVFLAACDSKNPADSQATAHPLAGTYAIDATYGAYGVDEWQSPPALLWFNSAYSTWLVSGDARIENDGAARFAFGLGVDVYDDEEPFARDTVVYAGRFESAEAGTVENLAYDPDDGAYHVWPVRAELHQGGSVLHVVLGDRDRAFGDTLRYVRVR